MWEYKIDTIIAENYEKLKEKLDRLGTERWELVWLVPMSPSWFCVFKRRQVP